MAENKNLHKYADTGDSNIGKEIATDLWVKDRFVKAVGIDEMMEEVFQMRLKDRHRIVEELMTRFVQNNYVNSDLEKEYRIALMDEYERRQLPYL